MVAGLVDSFGLALGWTLFNLTAVERGGLGAAALFNAAMLVGIVLSAPVTTWLARRVPGRTLLTGAATTELALRFVTIGALLAGWPTPAVAAGVVVMYAAAFAGFAAMRAEVAAVDARPRAMTRYGMIILAVEATGAAIAAVLPRAAAVWIIPGYGLSLVPTLLAARRARVVNASTGSVRLPVRVLAGGAGVALLAYGPTLLYVALGTELHGARSVAFAAVAFSLGCLVSPGVAEAVARLRLPATLAWPLWGVGMLAGWVLAPWNIVGLCVAQGLSGICLTAFEGGMDARLAQQAAPGAVTTVLAWTASTRAMGGAVAVRAVPVLVAAPAIGVMASGSATVLALGGVVATAVVSVLAPAGRHRLALAARP
jgi:hypothetical protein